MTAIDGTYVLQNKEGGLFSKGGAKIQKVPATDKEALKSDLMGLFEKRRCKNFFIFVQDWEEQNPKTHEGMNLRQVPFKAVMDKFQLEPNTIDFIGHAVALYANDQFLQLPAIEVIEKIRLYMDSMGRYGNSPFIYPIYGLGCIPEGFSRMCAINGGTFMLNTNIDNIQFNDEGKVISVQSGDQTAKCNMVICDPTYAISCKLNDKIKQTESVIRCICLMDHPIPNTKDVPSVQIIIPQRQVNRKSDIYIMMVSSVHNVCKKGYYVAIISTTVETQNPEKEIQIAFDLIGPVIDKFTTVTKLYHPVPGSAKRDNIFVSKSFGPVSHFEEETQDVIDLYKQITGKDLDLTNLPEELEEQ